MLYHNPSWSLLWQVPNSWPIYYRRRLCVHCGIYLTLLWQASGRVVCWNLSSCYRCLSDHRSRPCLGGLKCRRRLEAWSCDSDGHWPWKPRRVRHVTTDIHPVLNPVLVFAPHLFTLIRQISTLGMALSWDSSFSRMSPQFLDYIIDNEFLL
jgi:hypothetical protein